MFAIVVHQLVAADDVAFRDDIPVVGIAINARDFISGKLEDLKNLVRAIQRQRCDRREQKTGANQQQASKAKGG
jgi:hypothetical protein